jgi:hypothetical protein
MHEFFPEYFVQDYLYILFVGEKEADKTGKKKLFDATELEDADEDDITTSRSAVLPVNDANDNFVKILTSLLDSTVSTCVTCVTPWCRILI